jgi:hypothetical protein
MAKRRSVNFDLLPDDLAVVPNINGPALRELEICFKNFLCVFGKKREPNLREPFLALKFRS